ncbi:mitochondrial GTPase 1 isoform X2 [Brevipalpus obovatus]
MSFRKAFGHTVKPGSWFPLHMATGLQKIQRIIRRIDGVIEVHDARVPFSGRSSYFHQQIVGGRPHLLVLNKMDLVDEHFQTDVNQKLIHSCDRILYTSTIQNKRKNLDKIVPELIEVLHEKHRFHRSDERDIHVLVVGVPNVGKSSLINALRNDLLGKAGKPMATAPYAGVTKSLSERLRISHSPSVFLVDTPGILEPELGTPESPFRLALCGIFRDEVVGLPIIVDYLLFWLNRRRMFRYVQVLNLPEPIDNVDEVLLRVAMDQKLIFKGKDMKTKRSIERFDLEKAAHYIIKLFRNGEFGMLMLDDDVLYRKNATLKILPTISAEVNV